MKKHSNTLLLQILKYSILFIVAFIPITLLAQKEYYTPKSLIMPLHDQKNQLHVSAGMGGGYDLNLSFAFTDKLAIFHTSTFDIGPKVRSTILGDRYYVWKNDYVFKGGLSWKGLILRLTWVLV